MLLRGWTPLVFGPEVFSITPTSQLCQSSQDNLQTAEKFAKHIYGSLDLIDVPLMTPKKQTLHIQPHK